MLILKPDHEVRDQRGADRAHGAEFQGQPFQLPDSARVRLRSVRLLQHGFDIGRHRAAEFGEMRLCALAMEERAAKFGFQSLDRAGERRLGDAACLGCAREVELTRERDEIADLLHLHRSRPTSNGQIASDLDRHSLPCEHGVGARARRRFRHKFQIPVRPVRRVMREDDKSRVGSPL